MTSINDCRQTSRDDLLLVAKVADEAHSVIHAYTVDQEAGKADEQQVQEQAGS